MSLLKGRFFYGKNMNTVGIIGGLGPETTAKFQLEIISACLKNNTAQRPQLLMWNVPVPIKVENDLIINNNANGFLPLLKNAAKILEGAGADFLVMPCNTLHIFIEEIRNSVKIPVLNIIDETVAVIEQKKLSEVGVLATSTTINKNLLIHNLKLSGVKPILPDKKDQKDLDLIIHRIVTNKLGQDDVAKVNKIVLEMKRRGVKNIVLSCTDLQLIVKDHPQVEILDSMQIFAKATAREILKGGEKNGRNNNS